MRYGSATVTKSSWSKVWKWPTLISEAGNRGLNLAKYGCQITPWHFQLFTESRFSFLCLTQSWRRLFFTLLNLRNLTLSRKNCLELLAKCGLFFFSTPLSFCCWSMQITWRFHCPQTHQSLGEITKTSQQSGMDQWVQLLQLPQLSMQLCHSLICTR